MSGIYDYRVPDGLRLAPGDVVTVPLGRRTVAGVVWGAPQGGLPEAKLKAVSARRDVPPMTDVQRRFVDWIAAYTLNPPGAVLKMALSVPQALDPPTPTTAYVTARNPPPFKETPARRRVLAVAAEGPPRTAADLARQAAVGPAVVKGLVEASVLEAVSLPSGAPPERPDWNRQGPALSADQAEAARTLQAKAAANSFSATLLDGVPGSGKTEVYFQAIAEALSRGRQALVLLPEIALGAQWLERFRRRFGVLPVEWHSDLTQAQRRAAWRHVAEGSASVVVGARSALFLPFPDLGLIVVDEEHDSSFKQEDGPIYNARDMAVVRARLGNHAVVLASATPSLETAVNADLGRYGRLHLPDRHAGAVLPAVSVVDMRAEKLPAGRWLSDPLKAALAETFAAKEQAILFLNRRGYAPLTLCRTCGHRMNCPRCTAWLVEHRSGGGRTARLQCHHCGFAAPMPNECPSCGTEESFAACGPGVERLAEEVAAAFPDLRVAVAASDNLQGPRAASELVRRVEDHDVDLVIGTQIVAKGHHFPMLTLVGVVDADLGLNGGDLRAAERTYQLLYQVAGRAGRGALPGRVLLQTFMPDHPVMKALTSGDRDKFIAAETEARRRDGMPPFGRLAAVIVSGPDEAQVDAHARALARAAPRDASIQVLGPAPAPFALLRGRHRRRFLVKAGRDVAVQPILARWMDACPPRGSVRAQVDVDPYSFL